MMFGQRRASEQPKRFAQNFKLFPLSSIKFGTQLNILIIQNSNHANIFFFFVPNQCDNDKLTRIGGD